MDALQALPGGSVTIADGVRVDIQVAFAWLARSGWSEVTRRIAEESVRT